LKRNYTKKNQLLKIGARMFDKKRKRQGKEEEKKR
jgi:hypothetical protein